MAKKGVRENVPVDGSCVLETLGEAVEAGMGGVGRVLRGSALRAFNSELGDGGGGIAGDLLGAQPPCVGSAVRCSIRCWAMAARASRCDWEAEMRAEEDEPASGSGSGVVLGGAGGEERARRRGASSR